MSKESNNPDKYYRTGIAIPVPSKAILTSRLEMLGMKTIGDLVTFFIHAEGVVGALEPLLVPYRAQRAVVTAPKPSKRRAAELLKGMSPEQVAKLIELASSQAA